jgi:hypothetical protein
MADYPLPTLPAQFDPSKPFTQVPEGSTPAKPAAITASAPQFDPGQPFEAVPDAPATPAAQFNPNQPFSKLFAPADLAAKSPDELASDKEFNPTDFFASNPDVAKDPAQLKKLLEAYRAKREKGIEVGETVKTAAKTAIPTLGKFGKGVYQQASNLFVLTGLQDLANDVLGAFEPANVKQELMKEGLRGSKEAQAKYVAALETSSTGLGDLARTGTRKVFGKSVKDQTDQELLQELSTDAAFQTKLRETTEGRGEFLKGIGLDADELAKQGITLDPEVIENMSLVDPLTLVATGGVGKAAFNLIGKGGKVLATVPTVQAGLQVAEKLGTAIKPILEKLPTIGQVVGKPIEAAGQGITLAGRTAPVTGAVVGTFKGGPFGTVAGILAGERIGPRLTRAGEAVQTFGQQVAGRAPLSPALARIVEGTKLAAPLLTSPLKGAAVGAAVSLPLVAAAEGSEQAGAILGGGLGLGTAGGAVHGTARVGGELAAKTFFDPHTVKFDPVNSPNYGVDNALDTAHAANLAKRSVNEQGAVTTAREVFRPLGGEIYSVDKTTFGNKIVEQLTEQLGRAPTPEELAGIQGKIDAQGYFDFERPDGRKVVLLNSAVGGLWHETGHLTYAMLPSEVKAGLAEAVRTNYTPEQLSQLKSQYESRLGSRVSDAYFTDELIAENFNAVFNNVPVTDLRAPAGFLRSLGSVVAQIAEKLGVDVSRGRTSPDLNVPLTQALRAQFESAARDLLKVTPETPPAAPAGPATPPTPAGAPPTAPAPQATPPARNIRVTKAQQDALAERAAATGVPEARALAAKDADPNTAARVNDISAAMEAGNPVLEIEHLGIADTGTPGAPTGRAERRGVQSKGYQALEKLRIENRANAPADLVNLHQKTFTPVRWTDQGGTPTLIAMSADKVIANLNQIAKLASEKGAQSLLPYEVVEGKLTDAAWRSALSDVQAYAENQANGYRGDGQRLTRPAEGELSIPSENRDYVPTQLTPEVANFANLVQGLATPETAREVRGGKTPGNIKGQILAEANKRELLTPADIKAKNVGKQAFKSFPGRTLKEVNPLRNELAARGVQVRELLDVTERIRAKDIATVKQRPELNFKAPVTDVIRGGFLPQEQSIEQINEEIRPLDVKGFQAKIKEWGKGLTNKAFEVGQNVKSLADVQALRDRVAEYREVFKADVARGDLDAAGASSVKAQFFQEAIEAATGEGNKSAFIRQYVNPDYKPPFPSEGVQFLPRRRATTAEELPDYLLTPGQGRISALNADIVRARGTTPQFWLNAETGKVLLAPEGHVEAARDLGGIPSGADAPEIYDTMDALGWVRGVNEKFSTTVYLNGDSELSRAAKQTAEDLAFRADARVYYQGKTIVDKPNPPQFLPKPAPETVEKFSDASPAVKDENGNPKPFFHGSFKSEILVQSGGWDIGKSNKRGLFGPGFYFTDSPEVAGGPHWKNKIRKIFGLEPLGYAVKPIGADPFLDVMFAEENKKNPSPGVVSAFLNLKNPFDIEKTYSRAEIQEILKNVDPFDDRQFVLGLKKGFNELSSAKRATGGQIWAVLAEYAKYSDSGVERGHRTGRNSYPELLVQDWLKKSDFDGLTYLGGVRRKGIGLHSVIAAWSPEQIINAFNQEAEPGKFPSALAEPTGPTQFLPKKKSLEDRDFSKYDIQPASSGKAKLTGWVLPNKEFIPLSQSYHEQYLAENADGLNKKFGTKFSDDANVEERLAALNAGFSRIRYESGTGEAHVEVNAKHWGKQRKAILDQLLNQEDSIDRLSVSLLNDKGQVVDSIRERLFDVEGAERATKISEAIDSLRPGGARFLPAKDMTPKEQKAIIKGIQEDAEIKYPEAKVPQFVYNDDGSPKIVYGGQLGRQLEVYNFADTKLAKQAAAGKEGKAATQAAATALGDKLAEYYNSIKDNPEIAAGVTWYSLARKKLVELFGDDSKFFAELLGATSPQTDVKQNFKYALDAYNQFKAGKFDDILKKYREGKQKWATGDIQEYLDDTGKKLTGPKAKQASRGHFLNWWIEKNELVPYRSEVDAKGKPLRYGMHSKPLLRVLDGTWLEEVVGPKTPNFMGNLTGDTFEATIDIWAARALHRMGAEEPGKRWRILPESETRVQDHDFEFGQRAFRHAADKVGIQPDALQAILWFAEKDYYEKRGWTARAGKEKSDFNTFFAKTEKVGPGQFKLQEEPPKIKKKKVAVAPEVGEIAGVKLLPANRVRVERPVRMGQSTRGHWETVLEDGTRPAIFNTRSEAEKFISVEDITNARIVPANAPAREPVKLDQIVSYVENENSNR